MSGKNVTETAQASEDEIARAAKILRSGGIVAVPTETVYGLAARADSAQAVAKIYAAKGRPEFNPLIVHVRDLAQAEALAVFDRRARNLVRLFWPGPLSLILPLKPDADVARAVTAGLSTIGLRQPAHTVMRALLDQLEFPLAAPSANRSEEISPTRPQHVRASLREECPYTLDGGASDEGLESTIVALRQDGTWSLLRPGPITKEELEPILGPEVATDDVVIESPGQLARHYSPGKPIRLNVTQARAEEFLIGFGINSGDCNLSSSGDLNEAAASLYDCLHRAAASQKARIAIAPIPESGIGRAINDRLRRAAAD